MMAQRIKIIAAALVLATVVGVGCSASAPPPIPISEDPTFVMGVNITGQSTPESFTPLVDGDEIFIELGFQGSYMVVLAFQSATYVDTGKFHIRVNLYADDVAVTKMKLKNKKGTTNEDGFVYYYNIFLVTDDFDDYIDQDISLELELLTLDDELIISQRRDVVLVVPE
jgi:hypothetical protein